MQYGTGLLIGRFQPFHLGHLHAVEYALGIADELLLGIGSSNRSGEPENPFTAVERHSMILESLDGRMREHITICEVPDVHNHMRWLDVINETLPDFDVVFTNDKLTARLYGQRGVPVCGIPFLERGSLSGTAVRDRLSKGLWWEDLVPAGTARVLRRLYMHRP